ncbi:MAG TPA: LON peptidase substrate-binding domain-containing protein [Candidatus Acidoferrales bacterium]|jgi:Lon protease-like protein|nr:LON peptidase substrate-binding domain-containing protein [Candidatus Acidoferrales bacterium]
MPRRLRLFPLNAVLFPGAALNLHIFEARYKQMINECLESGEGFGVALIADGAEAGDPNVMPHDVGSIAEIVDVQPLPFGRFYISTVGRERFRITEIVSREPYLTVSAELLEDDAPPIDDDIEDLTGRVRDLFSEYLELVVEFSGQETIVEFPDDAQDASYLIGDTLQIAEAFKQRLLELDTAKERLVAERDFLEGLLPRLRRLLERRRKELEARRENGEDLSYRPGQEKFFGKYFSLN